MHKFIALTVKENVWKNSQPLPNYKFIATRNKCVTVIYDPLLKLWIRNEVFIGHICCNILGIFACIAQRSGF